MTSAVLRRIVIAASLALALACNNQLSSVEQLTFDPRLPGTWVSVTGDDTLASTPIVVNAVTINEDGTIDHLAAETATGIVAPWDPGYTTSIARTAGGAMFLSVTGTGAPFSANYKVSYAVYDSLLRISGVPSVWYRIPAGAYVKASVGDMVASGVSATFNATLDSIGFVGEPFALDTVSPTARAFARFETEDADTLLIDATGGDHHIHIRIEAFAGPGAYTFGEADSSLVSFTTTIAGKEVGYLDTTGIPDGGMVNIAVFDLASHRCVGTFASTLTAGDSTLVISGGSFSIPIYED